MSTPALPSFSNVGAILVALETTPGVEAVPGLPTAANYILASNIDYSPEFDTIQRNYYRPSFSSPLVRNANFRAKVSFEVELMGSGVAIPTTPTAADVLAAAPAWAKCLEACGMVATSVTSGSIGQIYSPTTLANTQKTVTLYMHLNGQLHKMTGCMGTFTIDLKAGEIGTVKFDMQGNYLTPTVVADPAMPTQTIVPPLVGGNFSFTGGGLTANTDLNAQSLSLSVQNEVAMRSSIAKVNGIDGFFVTGRKPQFTIDPERGTESLITWYSDLYNAPISSSTIQVGTASGNTCHINMAQAQMSSLQPGNRDNLLTVELTYSLVSGNATGNDEFSIKFT